LSLPSLFPYTTLFRSGAVLAQERDAVETRAEPGSSLAVAFLPLTLAHGALVPPDAEPLEVADDRLLAAGHVPRGVGVVDPQQQRSEEHTSELQSRVDL